MSFFEFPNTRTYNNDLGWLIKNVKSSNDAIAALEAWKTSAEGTISDLQKLLDNIAAGNFPEEISNAIKNWIVRNFDEIVGDMIKTVWFGLTDDGYFAAYIPESWQDVTFRTTEYDITTELMPEFGHLVLQANYYTHSL
ncbi:MAG: hypothetical protein J6K15_11190 [Lachnospiraceae bacterium]|nr:hypothetical protein [Lachnospiraceae bacterium]